MNTPTAADHWDYGYRLSDGREVWAIDHGTDGVWTPWDPEAGVGSIDIYDGHEEQSIRTALLRSGVTGDVIRRRVTVSTGPVEVVPADATNAAEKGADRG